MSEEPTIKDNAMYRLVREGNVETFNSEREKGTQFDLIGADFRGVNLTGINADGLDLSNCYFRQADLRGLDLRGANLDGASIHAARISGVYFPDDFSAEELTMSLLQGTRLRRGK